MNNKIAESLQNLHLELSAAKTNKEAIQVNNYFGRVGEELSRSKWNPFLTQSKPNIHLTTKPNNNQTKKTQTVDIDPSDVDNPTDFEYTN